MTTRPLRVAVVSALLAGSAHAASIGVKFLDGNDTAWTAGTSAGAASYAQTNWNFMQTDWSGSAVNDAAFNAGIMNSNGQVVSAPGSGLLQNISYAGGNDPVHFDAATTWRSGSGNTTANHTLMNGYLDDAGDNQPYVNVSLATQSGVFETYTVVLYINGDNTTGGNGRYWLETWTDPIAPGTVITDQVGVLSAGAFTGSFIQAGGTTYNQTATPTNVDASAGNYLVFTNVTARNLRIRSAGDGDPEDFGRGPLNGFQLIDTTVIPEPSVALLGGLSLLGLLRRRR